MAPLDTLLKALAPLQKAAPAVLPSPVRKVLPVVQPTVNKAGESAKEILEAQKVIDAAKKKNQQLGKQENQQVVDALNLIPPAPSRSQIVPTPEKSYKTVKTKVRGKEKEVLNPNLPLSYRLNESLNKPLEKGNKSLLTNLFGVSNPNVATTPVGDSPEVQKAMGKSLIAQFLPGEFIQPEGATGQDVQTARYLSDLKKRGVELTPEQEGELSAAKVGAGLGIGLGFTDFIPGGKPAKELAEGVAKKVAKKTAKEKVEKAFSQTIRTERLANFEKRLATGEAEVEDIIKDLAANAEDKTRGKVSFDEALSNIPETNLSERALKNLPQGRALNKEQTLKAVGLTKNRLQKIRELQQQYAETGNRELLAELTAEKELAAAFYSSLRGARAEAGRSLENWKNVKRMLSTEEDRIIKIDKFLKKQGESVDQFMDEISKINLENDAELIKFLNKAFKPKFTDVMMELRINGMLSGLKTHLRNFAGNALFGAVRPFEKALASAIDVPVAKIQGRGRERFAGEAIADLKGKAEGVKEVAKSAKQAVGDIKSAGVDEFNRLKNQDVKLASAVQGGMIAAFKEIGNKLDQLDIDRFNLENIRPTAMKGLKGELVRLPTRMLSIGDEVFKTINTSAELYSQAYRKAAQQSTSAKELQKNFVKIMEDPDLGLLKSVRDESEKLLFREEPGAFMKKISNLRSGDGIGATISKIILPFINTPANVLKQGVKRTPLAPLAGSLAKDRGTVQFTDDLSQIVFGSSIGAYFAYEAAQGNVTGSGSSYTKKEIAALRRQGWQPYSVKVGDKWVSYKSSEPLFLNLSTVADLVEEYQQNPDADLSDRVTSVATSIATNISSQSYLRGVSDFAGVLNEPERYREYFASNTVGSFIPYSSLLRSVTNRKGQPYRDADGVMERIQGILPGAADSIPPLRDLWGRPVIRENSSFFPFEGSTIVSDPLEQELETLDVNLGDVSSEVYGVKLNNVNYSEYKKWRQNLRENLLRIVQTDEFQSLNSREKEKTIENLASEWDQAVKLQVGTTKVKEQLGLTIPAEIIPSLWDAIEDKDNFKKLTPEAQKNHLEKWYKQISNQ